MIYTGRFVGGAKLLSPGLEAASAQGCAVMGMSGWGGKVRWYDGTVWGRLVRWVWEPFTARVLRMGIVSALRKVRATVVC